MSFIPSALSARISTGQVNTSGKPAIILAGGPSLELKQVARAWQLCSANLATVIAVNRSYRLAPWATVVYAQDASFWPDHSDAFTRTTSICWTVGGDGHPPYIRQAPMSQIQSGWGLDIGRLSKWDSGSQAIELAWALWQPSCIYLTGFDYRCNGWWHSGYGKEQTFPYGSFEEKHRQLASGLRARGCQVVNCTPTSALGSYPKGELP